MKNIRRPNTTRERAWRLIRNMETFTIGEVAILAESPYENIKRYIRALTQSGHVKIVGRRRNIAMRGREYICRLIKNTGPLAPVQKATTFLFDPNTGQYWAEDPEMLAQAEQERQEAEPKRKHSSRKGRGHVD